jgi:hypothetical protein
MMMMMMMPQQQAVSIYRANELDVPSGDPSISKKDSFEQDIAKNNNKT